MKKTKDRGVTDKPSWKARMVRYGKRLIKFVIILVVSYVAILFVGLIPINSNFKPASNGVEIFITSNAVHADIVLPIQNDRIDWRNEFPTDCFQGDVDFATHVAIGWGDKGFFINTPAWSDLKMSTAANALLIPSTTCLHVVMTSQELFPEGARSVMISHDQYSDLVDYVEKSFHLKEGDKAQIFGECYGYNDAFFEANGQYHLLNTCNSWVGGAMKSAGIKTPWQTTLPKSPFLYLPE